ncbi:hypothetical protein JCM11491_006260 [Sporobolomyces phaffii]
MNVLIDSRGRSLAWTRRFAEKREWIQDKITFLSTLPPIAVSAPLPPATSTTTNQDLEAWWQQHEAIEKEVEEYDLGDLTKMRTFAKEKSKHELSTRDTDLIEVCLTTIFALDKLLALLRKRRKSLVLLGYRLQWEEAVLSVWSSRRQLLEAELPVFLEKSKFSLSATPRSSSNLSLSPDEPSLSSVTSSSPQTSARRRLSSSATESQPSSSMSRQLRLQTFVLSVSSLKSHLSHLSTSLVPASATLLDRLIDRSPEPLPDAFLDEQDRVENTVRDEQLGLGRGPGGGGALESALDARVERWKRCDEVLRACVEVERGAARLEQLVDEETNKVQLEGEDQSGTTTVTAVPKKGRERIDTFEETLRTLRATLQRARENLGRCGEENPSTQPLSRLFPFLKEESTQLGKDLNEELGRAWKAYQEVEDKVGRHRKMVVAVERAQGARQRLRQAIEALRRCVQEAETMVAPKIETSDLEGEEDPIAQDYENRFDQLFRHADIEEGARLVKEGYGILAELGQVGIAPEIRRDVKQMVEEVGEYRRRAEQLRHDERRRRERSEYFRRVVAEVKSGRAREAEWRQRLGDEAMRIRWENGKAIESRTSPESDVKFEEMISDIRRRCRAALDDAKLVLEQRPQTVLSRLDAHIASLNQDLDALVTLRDAVGRTHAQNSAIRLFEQNLHSLQTELDRLIDQAAASVQAPSSSSKALKEELIELNGCLAVVSSELSPLISCVHLKIPFVSTSPSSASSNPNILPFDTIYHDASIKIHLNTLIARVQHKHEEAKSRIGLVEALHDTVAREEEAHSEELKSIEHEATSILKLREVDPDAETSAQHQATSAPQSLRHRLRGIGDTLESSSIEPAFHHSNVPSSEFADVFGDVESKTPSAESPILIEPVEISDLRAKVEFLRIRDWLNDGASLRLPGPEESKALGQSLHEIKEEFEAIETHHDRNALGSLENIVSEKEEEFKRVSDLADFSHRVEIVDSALSDLLDSIDAATPGFPSPSPTAPVPLSEAIKQANDTVTKVRLEAIPLADDRRVAQTMARIEESWAELLSMVEDARPRAGSAAISVNVAVFFDLVGRIPLGCSNTSFFSLYDDAFPTSVHFATLDVYLNSDQVDGFTRSTGDPSKTICSQRTPVGDPDPPRQLSLTSPRSNYRATFLFRLVIFCHPSAGLASSVSSRRSSAASSTYRRPSLSPENLSRIGYRSSPPRDNRRRYRPNLSNKLDREVGSIVNALDIHVPIEMADGRWSDESGTYKIGDKVYFCRILRSKNVMVRVGGGWLNLLQFIITHFAPAETINISPTTPVKRTFGSPKWISSPAMRDQLKPTQHPAVLGHSSKPPTDNHARLPSLSASMSMSRSVSSSSSVPGTPLRRSFGTTAGSLQGGLFSPPLGTVGDPTRRLSRQRPAIPVWKP